MDKIFSFFEKLIHSINIKVFDIALFEYLVVIFSIFVAIIVRGFFAKFLVNKIIQIVKKTSTKIDDNLFEYLIPPLRLLPIVFVFLIMSLFLNLDGKIIYYFEKINKSLATIFIFWFLHQSLIPISHTLEKLDDIFSKALIFWLVKSIKIFVIILGVVAILETWGIKIGPIIAGLGLFGVAIALGAQDLFKNLISGILIILEKRFKIGDIIELPNHATGAVEHIGFRSTLIRQFDTTLISIPNYIFSESAIINFTNRKYRRIKWIIGLTYETSINQLKNICNEIESYIISSENFIVSDDYNLFVRIEKLNDSSIDILLYTFTNTNEWKKYLDIKEKLVFEIKSIVNNNSSSFAFPSQSIYVEKK